MLAQFSRIALVAVAVVILHRHHPVRGRAVGAEPTLDDDLRPVHPRQDRTAAVAAGVALRNRRITLTLERRASIHPAALRTVRNAAVAEIVIAIAILTVAALLVAEVPGRIG